MRHAVPIGVAIIAVLLLLGAPFLGVRWGFPDDRVLPSSASARQVGDELRSDFAVDQATNITAVLPRRGRGKRRRPQPLFRRALDGAWRDVGVSPGGTFVDGRLAGPPLAPTGIKDGSAFLTVSSSAPLFSDASASQLDRLHAVATPADRTVQLAGVAQSNHDSVHAITSRLALVLGIIAAITLVLMFLLTGSVVLPVKAVCSTSCR